MLATMIQLGIPRYAGRVTAAERLHATVELPFKLDKLAEQTWRLEKLGNIVTYGRCQAALLKVAQTSKLPAGRFRVCLIIEHA